MFAVEHVGITVKNIDDSVRFYTALLGAGPIERTTWAGKDAEYVGRLMGQPGLTLEAAFFRLPGSNSILELGQFRNIKDGTGTPNRHYQTSSIHIGFYVDSIDGALERVKQAGAALSTPVEIMYGPYKGGGGKSATFQDPDGVNLQIMQVASRPGGLPIPTGG